MTHRARYREACQKAFADFRPDFSGVRCPLAEAEKILDMARQGFYSHEIAEAVGKSPKAIQKFFRRYQFPRLHNIEPPRLAERSNWTGGTKLMKGYLYQRSPNHPHGTKHGSYVATHRLVIEAKIARYLLPTEVVDHIDGNIQNNDPSNLRVFASNGLHLAHTLAGRVPNWSPDGKDSLDHARRKPRRSWKGRPIEPTRDS